jgi:hypothetical protein
MDKFKRILAALTILISLNATPSSNADSTKKSKPPCRIQIGHAHISKSVFLKKGIRAVKVNASSICNVPQSRVTLAVEIWKQGALGPHFVFKTFVKNPGMTFPGDQIDNFNTWRPCKNLEETNYFGKVYAKAFIQGRWQFASETYSLKPQLLRCGT